MQRMKERIEKEERMGRIVAVRHFKNTDRVLFCRFGISQIISKLISVIFCLVWSSVTLSLPEIY